MLIIQELMAQSRLGMVTDHLCAFQSCEGKLLVHLHQPTCLSNNRGTVSQKVILNSNQGRSLLQVLCFNARHLPLCKLNPHWDAPRNQTLILSSLVAVVLVDHVELTVYSSTCSYYIFTWFIHGYRCLHSNCLLLFPWLKLFLQLLLFVPHHSAADQASWNASSRFHSHNSRCSPPGWVPTPTVT